MTLTKDGHSFRATKARSPRMLTVALIMALLSAFPAGRATHARARSSGAGLCFGTLTITPAHVHLRGTITLHGSHFTCKSPAGMLFPTAAVILHKPHLGFTIFTVHIAANGTYTYRTRLPAMLLPESAISGGSKTMVATQPGTYYFEMRLFDVDLPTARTAFGHITVIR